MRQTSNIIGALSRIADRVESTRSCSPERPVRSDPSEVASRPAGNTREPEAIVRYVKLPDRLEKGNFDRFGRKVSGHESASVVLDPLPGGPWQCWGVFDAPLAPGQYGYLVFLNVKGEAAPGGAFTEWDAEQSQPFFTDKLLRIYSVQRAPGRARVIGRNDSRAPVRAAAGLLFVPPPEPARAEHKPDCPRRHQ